MSLHISESRTHESSENTVTETVMHKFFFASINSTWCCHNGRINLPVLAMPVYLPGKVQSFSPPPNQASPSIRIPDERMNVEHPLILLLNASLPDANAFQATLESDLYPTCEVEMYHTSIMPHLQLH